MYLSENKHPSICPTKIRFWGHANNDRSSKTEFIFFSFSESESWILLILSINLYQKLFSSLKHNPTPTQCHEIKYMGSELGRNWNEKETFLSHIPYPHICLRFIFFNRLLSSKAYPHNHLPNKILLRTSNFLIHNPPLFMWQCSFIETERNI